MAADYARQTTRINWDYRQYWGWLGLELVGSEILEEIVAGGACHPPCSTCLPPPLHMPQTQHESRALSLFYVRTAAKAC